VRRSRLFACGIVLYAALALTAFATGRSGFGELAAFTLIGLLLASALRRRSLVAWIAWLAIGGVLVVLARRGQGHLALDAMPALVNAMLCLFFARTLRRGREPLIARIIGVLEGPLRLSERGVAAYARGLTLAWAVLLGVQAVVLAFLAAAAPGGLFELAGFASPMAAAGSAWRWYAHLGSYVLVFAFLLLEYAWRRWHLRHVRHLPLPQFIARLARRWPALLLSLVDPSPRKAP
jgi:uncharacterized membrane protein